MANASTGSEAIEQANALVGQMHELDGRKGDMIVKKVGKKEKPYPCPSCGKSFRLLKVMNIHMARCTEKPSASTSPKDDIATNDDDDNDNEDALIKTETTASVTQVNIGNVKRDKRMTEDHVLEWTDDDVVAWLKTQGFGSYAIQFRRNYIRGCSLVRLTAPLLAELGVDNTTDQDRLVRLILRLKLNADRMALLKLAATTC